MALTETPCEPHQRNGTCAGFYTEAEIKMAELDDSRSVQEYHEVMTLFEDVFDLIYT